MIDVRLIDVLLYFVIARHKSCAVREITVCGEQGDNEHRLSASLNFNAKRF